MEITQYTGLTKKKWLDILYDYLFSITDEQFAFSDPRLEKHINLINLYEALEPPDRRIMKEGMALLLKDTPPSSENDLILYYVFHYCIAVRPVHAVAPLVLLYKSGLLKNRAVGNQNLHELVLLACSKYPPLSKDLLKSVEWSMVPDNDLNYILLGVRILSDYSAETATKYFSQIYPKVKTDSSELRFKLSTIVVRTGIDDIYNWVIKTWNEVPGNLQSNYQIFLTALNNAIPWGQLANMSLIGNGLKLILNNFNINPKMASFSEIIYYHHSRKIDDRIFKTVWTILINARKRTVVKPVQLVTPDILGYVKNRPEYFSLLGTIKNDDNTKDEEMLSVEKYIYQYNMLIEILDEIDSTLVIH